MHKSKQQARQRRKLTIRKAVSGSAVRPRLNVFRSAKHIYAQVINDEDHRVLASMSTLSPAIRADLKGAKKREQAKLIGLRLAHRCLECGLTKVVFDRGGFHYHGRIKALADGAREGGLQF